MAQDGAMAAPILPFKRTEAGWTCMLLSRCEKNGLFTVQKDFYDFTKKNNSLGFMSPKGLKHSKDITALNSEELKTLCDKKK